MKSIIIIALLVLCTSCNKEPKHPEIKFGYTEKILTIKAFSSTSVLFPFTNKGNDSLKIIGVSVACGCTKVVYPKTSITPGSEGVISIVYDNKKDDHHLGRFREKILVRTNSKRIFKELFLIIDII